MRPQVLARPARRSEQAPRPVAPARPAPIGVLQQAAGNAATARWLRGQVAASTGPAAPSIQRKRQVVEQRFHKESLEQLYADSKKKGEARYAAPPESKTDPKESKAETTKADTGKEGIFDKYYGYESFSDGDFKVGYPKSADKDASEYLGRVKLSDRSIAVDSSYRHAPEIAAEKEKAAVSFSDILWIVYQKAARQSAKSGAGASFPETIETHFVLNDVSQAVAYMVFADNEKVKQGDSWKPAQEEALALFGTPNLTSNVFLWKDYLRPYGIRIESVSIPANEEGVSLDSVNLSPEGKRWPKLSGLNFVVKLAKPKSGP